jgi:hypothetical protein
MDVSLKNLSIKYCSMITQTIELVEGIEGAW